MRIACRRDAYLLAVLAVVQVLRWLGSPRLAARAAELIGVAAFHATARKRHTSAGRLAAALHVSPSDPRVEHWIREAYITAWTDLLCLAHAGRSSPHQPPVEINGLQHLEQAIAAGNGVVLWESSNFGHRVLAKLVLSSLGFKLVQVHAQDHVEGLLYVGQEPTRLFRRVIQPAFTALELGFLEEILVLEPAHSLNHARMIANRLRANAIVCVAADGLHGSRFVELEFMGFQRRFPTGIASLGRMSRAAILPIFCFRDGAGRGHLVIGQPRDIPPARDAAGAAMRHYARLLESYVRRLPGQYRAWHLLTSAPRVAAVPHLVGGR